VSLQELDQAAQKLVKIIDKVQKITQYKTVAYYQDTVIVDINQE
jgi:hypothetical protein